MISAGAYFLASKHFFSIENEISNLLEMLLVRQ